MWIYNFSVTEESDWKAVRTRLIPPSLAPGLLGGAVLEQLSAEPEDLLRYAVYQGIFLTADECRAVYIERKWLYPVGTGKLPKAKAKSKTALRPRRKIDWAKGIVTKLFPGVGEAEKSRMVLALCGGKTQADLGEPCDESMLEVIAGLDPENAIEAKGVRKACFDRLAELSLLKQARPHAEAEGGEEKSHATGWTKKNFTPVQLKGLLPPAPVDVTVWIKRLPGQSSYCGYYDRFLPA